MNTFSELLKIYEHRLNIPGNEICQLCDAHSKYPLLPWQVGDKYFSKAGGVFIAGKPHRGKPGKLRETGVLDGRKVGKELFFKKEWAYWSYTRKILNTLYGDTATSWDHIALSNIVKCTSSETTDKTTINCATSCIVKNQVIFEEIKLMKPRKIIFFTWSMHRKLFREIPIAKPGSISEVTDIDAKVHCGKKELGWWDRTFMSTWGKVDFLILGHPERMQKNDYTAMVIKWLRKP